MGDAERLAAELTPVAVGPAEGAALREWVRKEGALRTLETGLGYAVSALFICEGLGPGGSHVAIDPCQHERFGDAGLRNLEDAGFRELVELLVERSEDALPRLLAEARAFDLAFLDGNHRFEGVFLDLVYCGKLLRPGSVVFVDDMQLPAVRKAVRFCVSNLGWTTEGEGHEGEHEWAVLRTGPAEAFNRPFDGFVEF